MIRSNEFHTYFRVNSVFWDPNVYGRYLALVDRRRRPRRCSGRGRARRFWLLAGADRSSSGSASSRPSRSRASSPCSAGLAVLAALRWSRRWTLAAVAVGAVGAVARGRSSSAAPARSPPTASTSTPAAAPTWSPAASTCSPNARSGATARAPSRPPTASTWRHARPPVTVSHTEPITVAAEQGLIGLAAYVALIVALSRRCGRRLRGDARTLGRGPPRQDPPAGRSRRAAVLAAFVALLVHTLAYAGFFEDPITWVLLAVGALAGARGAAVREPA